MDDDNYYVISSGEDGIDINGPLSESEVLDQLNEEYYGTHGFYAKIPDIDKGCFMERDGQEKLLIIRGSIVVPQPKEVVKEWALKP
jgi:hypothetical protein